MKNSPQINSYYDKDSDTLFISEVGKKYIESRELENGFFADFDGENYTGFTFFDYKKRLKEGFELKNNLSRKIFNRLIKYSPELELTH